MEDPSMNRDGAAAAESEEGGRDRAGVLGSRV